MSSAAAIAAAAAAAVTYVSEDVVCAPEVEVVCACSPRAPWPSTCFQPFLAICIVHLALLWISQHLLQST
jgi:hypothetical protein